MASERIPEDLPYGDVRAEIDAAARRASERDDFPVDYVTHLDDESARFALRTAAPGDLRSAIALLEEQTDIRASAPVESRHRGVATAKTVVRKAIFFAVNHLAEQTRAMGWATIGVGQAAAERIEQLEARVRALEARVAELDPKTTPEDTSGS